MSDTATTNLTEQVRELANQYHAEFGRLANVLHVGMAQIWEIAGMAMDYGVFDRNDTPKFFLGLELRLHDEPTMKIG